MKTIMGWCIVGPLRNQLEGKLSWNWAAVMEATSYEITQLARDVLGTSPEGSLKVLTSGTSGGPSGDS